MKKILSITILFMLITNSVFGFTYPEPDWGKLLEEKEAVLSYLKGLDGKKYLVIVSEYANRPNNPPIPVLIMKM